MHFLEYKGILTVVRRDSNQADTQINDQLVASESHVKDAFIHKHCLFFFLLKKPYNTTWRYGILLNLKASMCLDTYNRRLLVTKNIYSKSRAARSGTFRQENGVPQGGTLRSTLFIVVKIELAWKIITAFHLLLIIDR